MTQDVMLEKLEIIGYAESLTPEMTPQVVPPVFRYRDDHDKIVFPPFTIRDDRVENATVGTLEELADFERDGSITLLTPEPIEPRNRYDLWLDNELTVSYQSHEEIDEVFGEIARREVETSRELIRQGDLEAADKHLSTAMNANDYYLPVYLLKALIHRALDRPEYAELMRDMAANLIDPQSFELFVQLEHSKTLVKSGQVISSKENVIMGKPIPAGRGMTHYRSVEPEPHNIINEGKDELEEDFSLDSIIKSSQEKITAAEESSD